MDSSKIGTPADIRIIMGSRLSIQIVTGISLAIRYIL